jgi:hypothetical protein
MFLAQVALDKIYNGEMPNDDEIIALVVAYTITETIKEKEKEGE